MWIITNENFYNFSFSLDNPVDIRSKASGVNITETFLCHYSDYDLHDPEDREPGWDQKLAWLYHIMGLLDHQYLKILFVVQFKHSSFWPSACVSTHVKWSSACYALVVHVCPPYAYITISMVLTNDICG